MPRDLSLLGGASVQLTPFQCSIYLILALRSLRALQQGEYQVSTPLSDVLERNSVSLVPEAAAEVLVCTIDKENNDQVDWDDWDETYSVAGAEDIRQYTLRLTPLVYLIQLFYRHSFPEDKRSHRIGYCQSV